MTQGEGWTRKPSPPSPKQLQLLRVIADHGYPGAGWGEIWTHWPTQSSLSFRNFDRIVDGARRRGLIADDDGAISLSAAGAKLIGVVLCAECRYPTNAGPCPGCRVVVCQPCAER